MKKKYFKPEMEIIDLEDIDIITSSGDTVNDNVGDNNVPGSKDEGTGNDGF